uniref:ANK_REP_REGION domain-containing protein n=1 Tax=Parastrongyloides trichosuri TaxID=131310 RepID=A0A0N4Z121_PARTI
MEKCHDVDKFLTFDQLPKGKIKESIVENLGINIDVEKKGFENLILKHIPTVKEALQFVGNCAIIENAPSVHNANDMPKIFIDFVKDKIEYNDFWSLADCIVRGDYFSYSEIEIDIIKDIKQNHEDKNLNFKAIRKQLTKGFMGYCVDHMTRANLIMFLCSQQCQVNPDRTINHTHCEHMKMLLENLCAEDRYAFLTAEYARTKFTSLHYAAKMGSPCLLLALLSFGANPNVFDNVECSPMSYALMRDSISFSKVLLLFGCNINESTLSYPKNIIFSDSANKFHYRLNLLKRRMTNMKIKFKEWCEQYVKDYKVIEIASDVQVARGALYPGKSKVYPAESKYFTQTQTIRVDMTSVNGINQDRLENGLFPVITIIPFNYNEEQLGCCMSEFNATRVKFVSNNNKDEKETIVEYIKDNLKMEGTFSTSNSYPVLPLTMDPGHNGYFYMFRIPDNVVNITNIKIKYEIKDIKNPQYLNLAIALVLLQKIKKRAPNFGSSEMSNYTSSRYDNIKEDKYKIQFSDNIKSRNCTRIFVDIFVFLFSFGVIVSSPLMAGIPYILNYLDPKNHLEPICDIQCHGLTMNMLLKTFLLSIAAWISYCYSPSHLLPRLDKIRASLGIFVVFILFSFWVFYYFRVIVEEEKNYNEIINYSVLLLDGLLYTHYISIILIYFKKMENKFIVTITRDNDGEIGYLKIGSMTIQEAAVEIANYYLTTFSTYNDSFMSKAKNTKFKKPDFVSTFKVYDVENENNDNIPSIPKTNASAVIQAAIRRREGNTNFEELEFLKRFEEKLLRRKYSLECSTEEAFATLESFKADMPGSGIIDETMDVFNSSRTIFSIISKPLQKFLRLKKIQTYHSPENIMNNLQQCLYYKLSSKTFLQRFFSRIYTDRFEMKNYRWSILSNESVTNYLSEELNFVLKAYMFNSDKNVKLYCQISKIPTVTLSEESILSDKSVYRRRITSIV